MRAIRSMPGLHPTSAARRVKRQFIQSARWQGRAICGVFETMPENGLLSYFLETRPALLRYLATRGASPHEAEDILQDVSVRLASEPTGPVAQPRAYLYKMANNHFLLHRRTDGRRVRREEDWVGTQLGDPPEVDQQPSAESRLVAREQLAIFQAVLDSLPDRTRSIFRRFRLEGEPQREIAAELGISVSAVEKHVARAYEKILSAKLKLDVAMGDPRHQSGKRP